MEFPEFHRLIQLLYYYNELSNLFGQLDTNKDKRISFTEFKKGHQLIGQTNFDDHQLKEQFHRIDTNHGGYILFDEVSHRHTINRLFTLHHLLMVVLFSSVSTWPRRNYSHRRNLERCFRCCSFIKRCIECFSRLVRIDLHVHVSIRALEHTTHASELREEISSRRT